MDGSQTMFTPETVFNLIAANPQGRALVESLAKMNQLQQVAQQYGPQIQQMAQNPMQAMQSVGNWAQGAVNQLPQQQPNQQLPTNAQPEARPQQGGPPMNGMMGMAMDIVGKFENMLNEMNGTLKKLVESNISLEDQVSTLTKDNKALMSDLSSMKRDLGKLTPRG